jgi:hypothetical protein
LCPKVTGTGKRRERDLSDWHAYYQWIRTCAEHRVAIPYADYLADNMATDSVRLRRDFTVLLQLVEASAILHQQNRARDDQGRIIATACDYLTVRNLIADLISTAVGASVPRTVRQTVEAVAQLSQGDESDRDVTVKMLAEHLGIERSVAQRRLTTARQRGYVVNQEDSQGKPGRYRIGEVLPGDHAVLPDTLPSEHVCTHQNDHPLISQVSEGCAGVHAQRGDKSAETDELLLADDADAPIPEPPEDDQAPECDAAVGFYTADEGEWSA